MIYITLPTDGDTTALEQTIRTELVSITPEQFTVPLKSTPVIGMSIVPAQIPDAASPGGFARPPWI